MDKSDAIILAKQYKEAVSKIVESPKVYLYGSYSRDCAQPDSDIDIAVIIPELNDDWFSIVPKLWSVSRKVSTLIEPVLIEEKFPSPLYDDVMRTGIAI